jgi:hypothetical protein
MNRVKAAKVRFGRQRGRSIKQRTAQHDLIKPRQLTSSLFDRTITSFEDCPNDLHTRQRTRHELV